MTTNKDEERRAKEAARVRAWRADKIASDPEFQKQEAARLHISYHKRKARKRTDGKPRAEMTEEQRAKARAQDKARRVARITADPDYVRRESAKVLAALHLRQEAKVTELERLCWSLGIPLALTQAATGPDGGGQGKGMSYVQRAERLRLVLMTYQWLVNDVEPVIRPKAGQQA